MMTDSDTTADAPVAAPVSDTYIYDPTNPTGGLIDAPQIAIVYDELPLLEKIQAQLHDRDGAAAGHTDNANAILHLGLAIKALRERDRAMAR